MKWDGQRAITTVDNGVARCSAATEMTSLPPFRSWPGRYPKRWADVRQSSTEKSSRSTRTAGHRSVASSDACGVPIPTCGDGPNSTTSRCPGPACRCRRTGPTSTASRCSISPVDITSREQSHNASTRRINPVAAPRLDQATTTRQHRRDHRRLGRWHRSRPDGIGSLLLAAYDDNHRLVYIGHVGTGFTTATRKSLRGQLAIERPTTPLDSPPPARDTKGARWVEPRLVGDVEYREHTSGGCVTRGGKASVTTTRPAKSTCRDSIEACGNGRSDIPLGVHVVEVPADALFAAA